MSETTNPGVESVLATMSGGPAPTTISDVRNMIDGMTQFLNADPPALGSIHRGELVREVDGTRVTADVLVPPGPGPYPVLVYLHGGGWVAGSAATHHKLACRFAEGGYLVVNVDYRLAPEAQFPGGFEDCIEAVRWAAEHAPRFGGDPARLAIGGDSAGGNLAAAVAVALAADPASPRLSAALLIYGVYDFATLPTSETADGDEMMTKMRAAYLGIGAPIALLTDPRVSPLASAAALPPCFVTVGTADALLDQSRVLVQLLETAGVEHTYVEVAGMPHAFVQIEALPAARETIDQMLRFLDKHLARR